MSISRTFFPVALYAVDACFGLAGGLGLDFETDEAASRFQGGDPGGAASEEGINNLRIPARKFLDVIERLGDTLRPFVLGYFVTAFGFDAVRYGNR